MDDCKHPKLEIDRTLCPCGFRHVYCTVCESRQDPEVCPWIPADESFRKMMAQLWSVNPDPALD